MPGGALAAAGAVGGAVIGGSAAKKAAKTQANAANNAADMQWQQYQQTREDMAPWRNVGGGALGMLAQLYGVPYGFNGGASPAGGGDVAGQTDMSDPTYLSAGDPKAGFAGTSPADPGGGAAPNTNRFASFFASPDYQFRLLEGLNALNNNRATAGLLNSGGTLKAITKHAGDLASGEYNNYVNRLAALAGVGQTANYQSGALGANAAENAGNALMAGANARAGGIANQSGAWTNALGQIGNVANNYLANRAPYTGGYDFGASGYGSNPFANVTANDFGATPSFNFGASGFSF